MTPSGYSDGVALAERMAAERDERHRQLVACEAERDRYRRALAEIAALPRPAFQTERTWREIAVEALR